MTSERIETSTQVLPPLEEVLVSELAEYAERLRKNGFTVYVHVDTERAGNITPQTFFGYSREVDGRPCFGNVQRATFWRLGQPGEHHMPIKPSRENGSSMYVPAADKLVWSDVEAARMVARPSNWNELVGTQENRDLRGDWFHEKALVYGEVRP